MPLVLTKSPALNVLSPLAAEVEAQQQPPPTIKTYSPQVEKWRKQVWDSMPQQLKSRPDAAMLLDKSLYVMEGESGGSDTVPGDGGAAYGLYQSHYIPAGSDATTQINDMWRMVSNNPDSWTDWGQNATYQGKPFGALGRTPYPGDSGGGPAGAIGNSVVNTIPGMMQQKKPVIDFGSQPEIQQPQDFNIDTQGLPAVNTDTSQLDTQGLPAVPQPIPLPNTPNLMGPQSGDMSGDVPYDYGGGGAIDAQRTYDQRIQDSARRELYQGQVTEAANKPSIVQDLLRNQLRKITPVDPQTGGVFDGSYGPFDERQGQEFIDAPTGSPRAKLEASRQGQNRLGNAALALGTALPMIGAGPVATAIGAGGQIVGEAADKRLGLDESLNLPVLGKTGPLALVGGALGGSKGEDLLNPTSVASHVNPVGAAGRPWTTQVKPNLSVVQPGETPPGAMGITGKGKPDPVDFIQKARALGMSDEEIRSAFPGALEAAGGIDTAPQVAARTTQEQVAKGAAAERTYKRVFQQYVDDLKAEGYSDAEAKQIATGLSSREARRAAGKAPENLPEQKPNVLADEATRSEMQRASERARNHGNAIVPQSANELAILPENSFKNTYEDTIVREGQVRHILTNGERLKMSPRIIQEARDSAETVVENVRAAKEALVQRGLPEPTYKDGRFEWSEATGSSLSDRTARIARSAQIAGDPFSEAVRVAKGQGKSQLKQAIEEEEQKGKRRTPEENAALKAARTAGPKNPSKTLPDVVQPGTGRFEPPIDNPNAGQLEMGGQGGQVSFNEAVPELGAQPPTPRTGYGRLDAASVAERARLSKEYVERTGGTQMSEAEFRQQWNDVKTARDGGRRWPADWNIDRINAYGKLERWIDSKGFEGTGQAVEGAVARGAETPQTGLPGVAATDVRRPNNFAQSVYDEVSGVAGKFLSLKSSLSPPLGRSGLPRLLTNPRQALKEFGLSVKDGVSEEAAREIDEVSFRNKWISPYSKDGVSPYKGYTWDELGGARWDWGEGAAERAPGYEGRGKSKILAAAGQKAGEIQESIAGPGRKLGTGEGVSERQAAMQQNLNARGRYQETAQRMWDFEERHTLPHDKQMYEDLVKKIEHSQQRGGIGQAGIPLLFSARATSGRIQAALDSTIGIARHPTELFRPGATQESGKNLLSFVALNYGLAQLASEVIPGTEITYNPLPTIRIGKHHYDFWGGMKPIATLTYDLAKVFQKTLETRDVDKGLSDALLRSKDFLRNATSPLMGTLVSAAERKDFKGDPYSITQEIRSGNIFKDLGLNFVAESIWDAYKADELQGVAMDTPLAVLSSGVNTYPSVRDTRYDKAQELYGKPFDELDPEQQFKVNQSPEVKQMDAELPKSESRQARERRTEEINQQESAAELAFKNGQLSTPLPDIWRELDTRRRQVSLDLADEFKGTFAKFDKTQYEDVINGYYGIQPKLVDGQPDFDTAELAKQDYIKGLKPDERDWLEKSLSVTRQGKSDAHQKYLKYIDERKTAGYFDIKPDDPDKAKKLVALDKANPLQDALNWYWKGGVQNKDAPTLNSPAAVDYALQMDPKRPAKFAGLDRPVNQTPGVLQAWRDYSERIDTYYTKTVDVYKDQEAQRLYKTNYADLKTADGRPDEAKKQAVAQSILTQVRRRTPELEAILQYMGDTKNANGEYIVSKQAGPLLEQMIQKYGPEPPKPGTRFMVRQD